MRTIFHLYATILAVSVAATFGCNAQPSKPAAGEHDHGHDHGHASAGPHKGQLIELGEEEYHAELVHDDAAHKIEIYLLDGEAKKGVAIADAEILLNVAASGGPMQFKLPAEKLAEDPEGQSSHFVLVDEKLCEAMDDKETTARLSVTIAGKQYVGKISHDQDDHGHDHDHKHEKK